MWQTAINRARKLYVDHNSNINFLVDDIQNSKINAKNFDYIFERFSHVIPIEERRKDVAEVRVLDDIGILLLKCFNMKGARLQKAHTVFQQMK